MATSKAWNWELNEQSHWLTPCEESYYYAHRWQANGYQTLLDLGYDLGRHSIYFAKEGFAVSAIDLSEYGINH
jgi:2-polyprenyl-3-methyl-5-hydroxy-6-metoxy-1,4-benzoquinol methylase